jgi:GDPmannose 4,6-dehydratase
MQKKALITGISGQDGSYLAELLVSKGYEVHGVVLRSDLDDAARNLWRLSSVIEQLVLHPASIESYPSILHIVQQVLPDECYHLAAQSFVSYSFDEEFNTLNSNINGTHYLLSAVKGVAPHCRFFFAASSEMFGNAQSAPQDETTSFHPRSVYGITKATGFFLSINYRENHRLFACNGIMYNHESPRRGSQFVTRKITQGAARISLGLDKELRLGNLNAARDWGFAGDYVDAMWRMLQQDQPRDYVVATGQAHTVRQFCEIAFTYLGLDYREFVVVDPQFFRKAEVVPLIGNTARARDILEWQAQTAFEKIVRMMVDEDLNNLHK